MEIAFSLKRHASNYSTLHHSDIAARAAPLDPRLIKPCVIYGFTMVENFTKNCFQTIQEKTCFYEFYEDFK